MGRSGICTRSRLFCSLVWKEWAIRRRVNVSALLLIYKEKTREQISEKNPRGNNGCIRLRTRLIRTPWRTWVWSLSQHSCIVHSVNDSQQNDALSYHPAEARVLGQGATLSMILYTDRASLRVGTRISGILEWSHWMGKVPYLSVHQPKRQEVDLVTQQVLSYMGVLTHFSEVLRRSVDKYRCSEAYWSMNSGHVFEIACFVITGITNFLYINGDVAFSLHVEITGKRERGYGKRGNPEEASMYCSRWHLAVT